MFLIGLTGGIGSGKSTVSRILEELGCTIIDADIIAREVVEPGKPAWQKIRKHFGPDVFHADGSLNRDALGLLIFADESKRRLLNSITHPQIYRTIVWRLLRHLLKGEQFVVLDLPLLFETGSMLPFINSTVVVYCNRDEQIKRIRTRNGYSEEVAVERVNAQMPLDVKRQRADYVIDNSGSGDTVSQQVSELYSKLRRRKAHWKLRLVVLSTLSLPILLLLYFLR